MTENDKLAAVPLLSYNAKEKKFSFSEEAEIFLNTITKPFGVLTVAGMYRTGKSYLLNKILLEKQGFSVGPTVNPCTKGLWLWPELLPGVSDEGEPMDILLVDTEGFGAYDEDVNHDTKIFTFAILISSYFVYNSVGTIDEKTVQSLSFVVNMSKHIQLKSSLYSNTQQSANDLAVLFPKFTWVLRDFSLKLVTPEGKPMTADEYLESVLNYNFLSNQGENSKEKNKLAESKMEIRQLIKTYFKKRNCYTLIRPVEDEKDLQNLPKLKDDQLRPEFLEQINELRSIIKGKMKFKTFQGQKITGEVFVSMVKSFAHAVNTGGIPNIENTWTSICKFDTMMKELLSKKLKKEDFEEGVRRVERDCFNHLMEKSFNEASEEQQLKLKRRFKEKLQFYNKLFDEETKIQLGKLLNDLYIKAEKKLTGEKISFSSINSEINLIFKQTEVEVDSTFCDFQGKYELLQEYKTKIYSLIINEVVKKAFNDYELKIKENSLLVKNAESNILEQREKFERELEAKQRENNSLQSEIRSTNSNMSVLNLKLNTLSEEKANLAKDFELKFSKLSSKNEEYSKKLQEKEGSYSSLSEKVKTLEKTIEEKNRANDLLKKENEDNNKHFEEKIQAYKLKDEKNNTIHSEKIKDLETLLKQKEEDNETLKKKNNERESSNKQLLLEIEGLNKKAQLQISSAKEKAQKSEEELLEKLQEKEKYIEKLLEEVNEQKVKNKEKLQNQETQYIEKINILEDENSKLIFKLKTSDSLLQESKLKEQAIKEEIIFKEQELNLVKQELQQSLENLKKQHDENLRQLETKAVVNLGKEESAAKERIENMKKLFEQEINDLKLSQQNEFIKFKEENENQNKKKDEKIINLSKELNSKTFELEEIKNDLESSNMQLVKIQKEKKLLQDSIKRKDEESTASLRQEIAQKDQEIEEINFANMKKINELNKKFELQANELKQMFNLEKEKIEEMKKQEKLSHEKKMLEKEEEFQSKVNKLEEYISKQDEFINEYKEQIDVLKNEIEELKIMHSKEKETFTKTIEQLKIDLKNNSDYLAEEQSKKQELCITISELQNENKEQSISIKQKENDIERKNLKIDDLEREITLNKEINLSNLKEKEDLITQKDIKIQELSNRINELSSSTIKSEFEFKREEALLNQQIEFLQGKIEDLNNLMSQNQIKYESTLFSLRSEIELAFNQKFDGIVLEKEQLEQKNLQIKMEANEIENKMYKQICQLEKNVSILNEKNDYLETKIEELKEKHQKDLLLLGNKDNEEKKMMILIKEKETLEIELTEVKENLSKSEKKVFELKMIYENDKMLFENKINYYETEKISQKKANQDNWQKYQDLLQEIQSKSKEEYDKMEKNYKKLIENIELNYKNKEDELIKLKGIEIKHLESTIVELEKQLKSKPVENNRKVEEKLLERIKDLEDELLQSHEDQAKQRQSYEQKITENHNKSDLEKENLKKKLAENEKKLMDTESSKGFGLIEFEKQRQKWAFEVDDLNKKISDLEDEIRDLNNKLKSITKENDKLKGTGVKKIFHNKIPSQINVVQKDVKEDLKKIEFIRIGSKKNSPEKNHKNDDLEDLLNN